MALHLLEWTQWFRAPPCGGGASRSNCEGLRADRSHRMLTVQYIRRGRFGCSHQDELAGLATSQKNMWRQV